MILMQANPLLIAISGPKKFLIFSAPPPPFQWPWMLPALKSLRPALYKQQVHSFMSQ